jgi:hypothetical protein
VRNVRSNNSPVWGGWLFVGLAAGVLLLRHGRSPAGSSESVGLAVVAAIFAVAGGVVVVRAFRQTITLSPEARSLTIEDRTRFSTQRRVIRFDAIQEVTVEAYTDPDPDAWPFQQTTHRVVVRLRDGTELPITDFAASPEFAAKTRSAVDELLRHGEARRG